METAILICCGIIILLLTVILIKQFGSSHGSTLNDIKNAVEQFSRSRESDNRMLMEQSSRQNEAAVNQIDRLGRYMREAQDRQQRSSADALTGIEEQMKGLRRENRDSLEKINGIVTEKMQSTLDERLNAVIRTVVNNMSELGKNLSDSQSKQEKSTVESLEKLSVSFENIRREINSTLNGIRDSNAQSMEKLRRDNRESLDRINATVNEKLQKTLDDKISRSFEAVNQRLKEVYEGLGEMKNVAHGVNDLKNVLSNVKTRGTLGEIQLGAILEDILAAEQYGSQVQVDPNSGERVDYAVRLPGTDNGYVWLPIDSKFPGDTYAALLKSYESGDASAVRTARRALSDEIKSCAKSIREKYVRIPYTTNFAIMFLPFEGLYAEVVNMGMIETLQRDYQINITGPSTMAAMLNSLQMGFRTLAIQKKSGEVWKILEAAKKEFSSFSEVLEKTRSRLRQADEELEKLVGTRTNQINRKLSSVSALESDEESKRILEDK